MTQQDSIKLSAGPLGASTNGESSKGSPFQGGHTISAADALAAMDDQENLGASQPVGSDSDLQRFSAENGIRLNSSDSSGKGQSEQEGGRKPEKAPNGPLGFMQAERGILGALMRDNSLYDIICEQMAPEDFSDATTSKVFLAIADILEGKIEGITVAEPFTVSVRKGIARVAGVQKLQSWASDVDTTDPATIASRAQLLHEEAVKRRMGTALETATNLLTQDDLSAAEKSEQIAKLVDNSSADLVKSTHKSAASFARLAVEKLIEHVNSGKELPGLPYGISELDQILGSAKEGQLIIIAARPSVGKTSFALTVAHCMVAAGYPGLFISMEMPGEQLAKRSLALLSKVDSMKLQMGALEEDEWARVFAAVETLETMPLEFNESTSYSLKSLRAEARRLHRDGKLKFIIIDYLQLMDGNPGVSREQQISEISRGLKKLALELKIPIIALSQLNRAVEKRTNKKPNLSDLRESGAIEQDSDVIIFIQRDLFVNPTHAVVEVGKNRDGAVGEVAVGFHPNTTAFYSLQTQEALAA